MGFSRRNGLVTSSWTEEYETKDVGDIYDVMEEEEYHENDGWYDGWME